MLHLTTGSDAPADMLAVLRRVLSCPITGEVFVDPVYCKDSFTYERRAILGLIRSGPDGIHGNTSPLSQGPIHTTDLKDNHFVRLLVKLLKRLEAKRDAGLAAKVDSDISGELGIDSAMCPISHAEMKSPVMTKSGHTYDRKYIEKWLKDRDCRSPQTRRPNSLSDLRPNFALKSIISELRVSSEEKRKLEAVQKDLLMEVIALESDLRVQQEGRTPQTPPRKRRCLRQSVSAP